MIARLLLAAGAIYGVAVTALYLGQESALFPRHATPPSSDPLPPGTESWELLAAGGERLYGYHIKARGGASKGVVIGFTGNAWNARDFASRLAGWAVDHDVVVFHYRGYAPSEGEPGEAALLADAEAIFDQVAERLVSPPVYAAGFSIGSGVAAHLATARPVAGAVLVTPFDSIRAVASSRYRWAPVRPLLRHPFESAAKLEGETVPTAIIAASEDRVVPPERTLGLKAALRSLVFEYWFDGASHASLYDDPEFGRVFQAALVALAATRGSEPSA